MNNVPASLDGGKSADFFFIVLLCILPAGVELVIFVAYVADTINVRPFLVYFLNNARRNPDTLPLAKAWMMNRSVASVHGISDVPGCW